MADASAGEIAAYSRHIRHRRVRGVHDQEFRVKFYVGIFISPSGIFIHRRYAGISGECDIIDDQSDGEFQLRHSTGICRARLMRSMTPAYRRYMMSSDRFGVAVYLRHKSTIKHMPCLCRVICL